MSDDKIYIDCACGGHSHFIKFHYDEEFNEIYMYTYMSHYHPWYKRLYLSIRYIFKMRLPPYGHFTETVILGDEALKLKEFCSKIEE